MAAALALRDRSKDTDTRAGRKDTQADRAPAARGGAEGPPSEGVKGAGLQAS